MELEMEQKRIGKKYIEERMNKVDKTIKKLKSGIFYYKHDGTIRNGTEMVSHPFTLTYFKKKLKFKKICEELIKHGFYTPSNCGLHIHLNKSFFTEKEIVGLRIFFSTNENKLKTFSLRKHFGAAPFESYLYDSILKGYKSFVRHSCNINSRLKNTIEIRLFAATLDYNKIVSNLEFLNALSYFIKQVSIVFLNKKSSWKYFIEWCKQQNRYNIFLKDVKKLKLK